MAVEYSLQELQRLLTNLIRLGTIQDADYRRARVRVASGDLLTDWLPWITGRASHDRTWWAPELGEQVLILSPDGELANGVVLPAVYQSAHPPLADRPTIATVAFADGTTVVYDRAAKHLTLDAAGDVTVHAQGDVTITGRTIRLNR